MQSRGWHATSAGASSSQWLEPAPEAPVRPPPWKSVEPVPREKHSRAAQPVEPVPREKHSRAAQPVNVERHPTEEQFEEIMQYQNSKSMSKRLRMTEKGFRHMENLRMQREDKLSDLRGSLEQKPLVEIITKEKIVVQEKIVIEERIVEVYVEKAAAAPGPRFQRGQSVHQWWAPWMDGAKETPSGIRKKSRPSWFSSEVFAGTAVSPSMPDAGSNFRSPACQLAC